MKFFKESEFACPCCGQNAMQPGALAALDRARGIAEIPFRITSGFRCLAHNQAVGGVETSAHLTGHAVDIATPTSEARFLIHSSLILAGFKRIGVAKGFIHVDDDPGKDTPVEWLY